MAALEEMECGGTRVQETKEKAVSAIQTGKTDGWTRVLVKKC